MQLYENEGNAHPLISMCLASTLEKARAIIHYAFLAVALGKAVFDNITKSSPSMYLLTFVESACCTANRQPRAVEACTSVGSETIFTFPAMYQ